MHPRKREREYNNKNKNIILKCLCLFWLRVENSTVTSLVDGSDSERGKRRFKQQENDVFSLPSPVHDVPERIWQSFPFSLSLSLSPVQHRFSIEGVIGTTRVCTLY